MKNHELPNEKEWTKIINEAFVSDDEHIFSERYNAQKERMQRGITMKRKINRKRVTAVVAAAIAAAVLIPTTGYAYSRISSNISKTANYRNTLRIETPGNTEPIAEEGYMYYEFGWLPESYYHITNQITSQIETDDVKPKNRYVSDDRNGVISPQFYKIPEGKSFNINFDYSEDCENYEKYGKSAMISYRVGYGKAEDGEMNFGRNVIVTFDGTSYVLDMTLTDDISRDELLKIIDNLKLIPTEKQEYGSYIPWLDKSSSACFSPTPQVVDTADMDIYHIGDTISYQKRVCSDGYIAEGYSVTLNSVEVTDSFEGIYTDGCGLEADFSEFMDENGNVRENTRSYIRRGDGVNTIDEVVSTENVPMHILKVKATYTNDIDVTREICIDPNLFMFKDGVPTNCYKYDGDLSIEESIGRYDNSSHFSFNTAPEYKDSKNGIILEPGESAEVELAYFVADDELDGLYMYFLCFGSRFDDDPVYDIRQQN